MSIELYSVEVSETIKYKVLVAASSLEDAEAIAGEMEEDGKLSLEASDSTVDSCEREWTVSDREK